MEIHWIMGRIDHNYSQTSGRDIVEYLNQWTSLAYEENISHVYGVKLSWSTSARCLMAYEKW